MKTREITVIYSSNQLWFNQHIATPLLKEYMNVFWTLNSSPHDNWTCTRKREWKNQSEEISLLTVQHKFEIPNQKVFKNFFQMKA